MSTLRLCLLVWFVASSTICGSVSGQFNLDLNWSNNDRQFIYKSADRFFLVDVDSKSKETLCDDHIYDQLNGVDSISFGGRAGEFILRKGSEYFELNRDAGKMRPIDRPRTIAIPSRLQLPMLGSVNGGSATTLQIKNNLEKPFKIFWVDGRRRQHDYGKVAPGKTFSQNTYVGHAWLLLDIKGKKIGSFRTRENDFLVIDPEAIGNVKNAKRRNRQRSSWKSPSRKITSPDGKWTVRVRNHNLWVNESKLSDDGSNDETFLNVGSGTHWHSNPQGADVRWSPDSRYLVAFQTTNPAEPRVHFVESTPEDQIQPKLQSYQYAKPGDDLPKKKLRLFDIVENREISVSDSSFENPWSLRFVRWVDNGEKFWLHYNQRGHQVIRLVEVTTATGAVRTLIEESCDTFIHYSNGAKSVFEPLPNNKILWASERSGWNHLYRFDAATGELVNSVTSGDWNVKRIESVDRNNGLIWFYAVGVMPDQDPYHEHFCRVSLDGSDFKVLTDGDGTHRVTFEKDRAYIVDNYSRVDRAPVTELRDAATGEKIVELESRDTIAEFGQRRLTTRFKTKGRDGETDIWGIVHWPKSFDPNSKYPVVEQIYAGPHDHHVPKSFRKRFFFPHQIADQGMIVVQIDGMGTAWRSKQFHDVCYKNLKDGGFPDRIAWIKAAAKKYPQMDIERVGIFGGSAGGQNAMAALLWHNDFYKVAVADCGCHDNRMDKIWWNEQWMGWPVDESYTTNSNMENAHLLKGHLMLTVGEMDRNVDPATTTQVVKKLIEHDKDFEFVLLPAQGHGAGDSPWAARKRLNFFKRHLQVE